MKRPRLWYLLTPAVVVFGLGFHSLPPARGQTAPALNAALAKPDNAPGQPPAPRSDTSELALKTLAGQPASLVAWRGKVVVVYFWASWCPPCQAGLPEIQALARATTSAKVAFVLLALDADADKVRAALTGQASTLPVYLAAAPVPMAFEPPSLPAVVVLNPGGQVAAQYERPGGYDTPEFKATLKKLAQ